MADIQDLEKVKILTEIRSQNLIEEEKKKQLEAKYNQGFQEGAMNGYEKGEQVGYEKGEAAGYQYGYQNGYQKAQINMQLSILDFYFNNFVNGKGLINIEIIGQIQIPLQTIEQRYGITSEGQQFIKELLFRNLIIY